MAERANNNKRQRSTSFREDDTLDHFAAGDRDSNTMYVPYPVEYILHIYHSHLLVFALIVDLCLLRNI